MEKKRLQIIKENYALYNTDCMEIIKEIPDETVDFSVYSPPFAGLYNYSSDHRDFSNCSDKQEFLEQYEFLIKEVARCTKKGRITAVHCSDVSAFDGILWDFPSEIIKLHEKYKMHYFSRITIWKEPLKVRIRTMVQNLMHKFIVEDATKCSMATPDYILLFKKVGENEVPVTHVNGLTDFPYFGETPFLQPHINTYGDYTAFRKKWLKFTGDARENKLAHVTWQRYASSMWDDIRLDNTLPYKASKEEDDEKHVHPLQLDVIDRLVYLYTNPDEVVLTPFMGVGSEVYSAISLGRKAIGIELKRSYFKQAVINLKEAGIRFSNENKTFFD